MRPYAQLLIIALTACNRAPSEPVSNPSLGAAPPPAQPAAATSRPDHISARHVLVMHRGSERVPDTITRTREEARARIDEVLARARRGEDFAGLARQFSDEPGASTSGGDLGSFGHGRMVPPFEAAAFALEVGAISDVVETSFGFHVIKRTQ